MDLVLGLDVYNTFRALFSWSSLLIITLIACKFDPNTEDCNNRITAVIICDKLSVRTDRPQSRSVVCTGRAELDQHIGV